MTPDTPRPTDTPQTAEPARWLHFVGVGGSGMSGLAQLHALAGGRATGSDRAFDQGERQATRNHLEASGVTIVAQDDQAVEQGCTAVIASTAIESSIADIHRARELQIPVWHRSELLAQQVAAHRTVAITGTSGKSTVTAMVFTVLQGAGHDPSLLTGGPLCALAAKGYLGNAWAGRDSGRGGWLVIEADESDGSLVRYWPWAGVVLNLQRDHKEPAELAELFRTFKQQTSGPFLVAAEPNLRELATDALVFGVTGDEHDCDVRAEQIELGEDGSSFRVDDVAFTLPVPGLYNLRNAVAAIAVGRAADIALPDMVAPLADFRGVTRRFQRVGQAGGVEVIDDFAHNPDKIAAVLTAARPRARRILAIFQPHGFGPTRFMADDLVEAFVAKLRPEDILWLPEIYYAGGSVTRDISAADLVAAITARGRDARFLTDRAKLPAAVAEEARSGDLVLVMGARDPSLTGLCRDIVAALHGDK